MADFTNEDEAFIMKFVGLTMNDTNGKTISLPDKTTTSIDWKKCLLLRIVTSVLKKPRRSRIELCLKFGPDHPFSRRGFSKGWVQFFGENLC